MLDKGEGGQLPLISKSRPTLSMDCLDLTSYVLVEKEDYCPTGYYAYVEIHLIQEIPYVRGMRFRLRDGRGMLADGSVL